MIYMGIIRPALSTLYQLENIEIDEQVNNLLFINAREKGITSCEGVNSMSNDINEIMSSILQCRTMDARQLRLLGANVIELISFDDDDDGNESTQQLLSKMLFNDLKSKFERGMGHTNRTHMEYYKGNTSDHHDEQNNISAEQYEKIHQMYGVFPMATTMEQNIEQLHWRQQGTYINEETAREALSKALQIPLESTKYTCDEQEVFIKECIGANTSIILRLPCGMGKSMGFIVPSWYVKNKVFF